MSMRVYETAILSAVRYPPSPETHLPCSLYSDRNTSDDNFFKGSVSYNGFKVQVFDCTQPVHFAADEERSLPRCQIFTIANTVNALSRISFQVRDPEWCQPVFYQKQPLGVSPSKLLKMDEEVFNDHPNNAIVLQPYLVPGMIKPHRAYVSRILLPDPTLNSLLPQPIRTDSDILQLTRFLPDAFKIREILHIFLQDAEVSAMTLTLGGQSLFFSRPSLQDL